MAGFRLGVAELAVILIFGIPLVAILGSFAIAALKILRGSSSRQMSAEESRLVQEIHNSLQRMEQRVDALETILLERDRWSDREGARR
ncbi:MAG TPA: hypothetical protein PKH07_01700 [bacterium]|nr:hypothetical protein [bacterium]